jgi:hypothetical protein
MISKAVAIHPDLAMAGLLRMPLHQPAWCKIQTLGGELAGSVAGTTSEEVVKRVCRRKMRLIADSLSMRGQYFPGRPPMISWAPSLHLHPASAVPSLRHIEYFHDHVRIEHLLFDGE